MPVRATVGWPKGHLTSKACLFQFILFKLLSYNKMPPHFQPFAFDTILTRTTPPYEVTFEDSRAKTHNLVVSSSGEPVQVEVMLSNQIRFEPYHHVTSLHKLNGEEQCRVTLEYYPLDEWRIEGIRVRLERRVSE